MEKSNCVAEISIRLGSDRNQLRVRTAGDTHDISNMLVKTLAHHIGSVRNDGVTNEVLALAVESSVLNYLELEFPGK